VKPVAFVARRAGVGGTEVVEAASGHEPPAEGAQPPRASVFLQRGTAERGMDPRERALRMFGRADVESPIDENEEAKPRSRVDIRRAKAARPAIREFDHTDPGHLRYIPDQAR
jgi:hypothetical protein